MGVTILLVISSITSANAEGGVSAFGGQITDSTVEKGSELRFVASIANTNSSETFIQEFIVLFVEDLGQSATRDPQELETVRVYEEGSRILRSNNTFTDNTKFSVDYEIGKYDVSIYFRVSSTSTAPEESWDSRFALANATIEIIGTSESLQIARVIGFIIAGLAILLVGLMIYNKFLKKS